jgi:hypothetical protein
MTAEGGVRQNSRTKIIRATYLHRIISWNLRRELGIMMTVFIVQWCISYTASSRLIYAMIKSQIESYLYLASYFF